ncbi:S5A-reductase domain-containing protein [Favolaschia claudopus]|uniref:S5A-reductase domain-containing protein n=1 Tax=Favolaschia claudopus TaxID=2862362 RepID=A0AAV9ZR78_9AGAR
MSTKAPTPGPFQRGNPNLSISGTVIFALVRLADAPLQYFLFTRGWAVRLLSLFGFRAAQLPITLGPGLGGIGPVPTLLVGMCGLAAVRHAHAFTSTPYIPVSVSLSVALYNAFVNAINTLATVHTLSSITPILTRTSFLEYLDWHQYIGFAVLVAGLAIEFSAEASRKRFKGDPRNRGKLDDTGLWSVVRHPNYLGFFLSRVGISLATGSYWITLILNSLQFLIFYSGGIPDIEWYMAHKYGAQWEAYTRRVRWAIIPGVV